MMSFIKGSVCAGLIAILCLPTFGEVEFTIDSLDSQGQLSWTNYPGALNYRVEWTSNLETGPWHSSWSNLTAIVPTGSNYTVQVPMFYRVVVEVLDNDDDGWSVAQGDCDDSDPTIHPGAVEIPYDGIDQNCDGLSDYDQDQDGFELGSDCDDTDPTVHPGAVDIPYDGIDQDCNGADADDLDNDGFTFANDCNDTDPSVYPGAAEIWYDGVDQNCDGASDYDQDQDGFDSAAYGGDDCDDLNPAVNPDATEICGNSIDDNCADGVDEFCP